jgi:glycosyltransferase involved in cell wall biosynthesis
MDSQAPLVTIVTPFYNNADFLAECIESVLAQSYENWEYVLLNNCSTDRSAEIAEGYVKQHPGRIRLEHNEKLLPQVQNYNRAFTFVSAQSKYCKFVQADDWMFPRCLEMMVETAERDPSIGVVGSYALEGDIVEFDGLPYSLQAVSGRDVCRMFFLQGFYMFGSPTQLLLRSDLVLARVPFFDESYLPFEDAAAIFELLERCNFGFVHQVLTFSRRDNASTMRRLLDIDCPEAFLLLMMRDFGAKFLDAREYREQLARRERVYARVLMEGAVAMRGEQFWKFHTPMRKKMGYTFDSGRTWWLFVDALSDVVLNPKKSLGLFFRGMRGTPEPTGTRSQE